jgi:hypothetical protein
LVAIQLRDDFDSSSMDPAMERDIDVLSEEIVAAGIGVFVGGLHPTREAKSLRAQPDGKVLVTDGETKEHIGGLWVIEIANMDEGVAWSVWRPGDN